MAFTARILLKHRGFTLINVVGLATGLLAALVILLYVRDELGYDRYHSKADRIYRLVTDKLAQETVLETAVSPSPAAAALVADYPEVLAAARMTTYDGFFSPKVLIRVGEESYLEDRLLFADGSILEIFDFTLVAGDPATALHQPDGLVISESLAAKLFGGDDPLGRVVEVGDLSDYTVTGVFRDLPANSHVKTRMFASFVSFERAFAETPLAGVFTDWTPLFFYTYLLLDDRASAPGLAEQLEAFLVRHVGPDATSRFRYHLEALTDIHFRSNRLLDLEANSQIAYVYIPATVGLFVLLIAGINFMNLSTARSAHRAKEIGVRKVVGARRGQLVAQFLGESLLLSAVALALALVAFHLLVPAFNAVTGKELTLGLPDDWTALAAMLAVTVLVGLAAGIYPAFFLSSFAAAGALKGTGGGGGRGTLHLRRGLVVLQLALSVLLIAGTVVAYLQLDYLRHQKLGLNEEHVLVVPVSADYIAEHQEALREEVSRSAAVLRVGLSSAVPGAIVGGRIFSPEGKVGETDVNLGLIQVDYGLIETLEIELLEGRNFSPRHASDDTDAYILNRAAAAAFGWPDSALGQRLEKHPREREEVWRGAVIGVVEDFQIASLRNAIEPALLYLDLTPNLYLMVRAAAERVPAALDDVERAWHRLAPQAPFDYFFLDSKFDELYRKEAQLRSALTAFAAVAVFVACLGMLGLVSFMVERRTKEIGVRKILGASVTDLVLLLARDFLVLVVVSNLIAWPIAYFAIRRWLAGFAYQVEIGWWIFPAAGLLVAALTLATVSLQAVPAARAHPAAALRDE